jgi:hypothetical protein
MRHPLLERLGEHGDLLEPGGVWPRNIRSFRRSQQLINLVP